MICKIPDEHDDRDAIQENLDIEYNFWCTSLQVGSLPAWLIHAVFFTLFAAGFRNFPVGLETIRSGPNFPAIILFNTTAAKGWLEPVPELIGQHILFPEGWQVPAHFLDQNLQDCLPTKLSMQEDHSPNRAPKEDKQNDNKASKHTA